MLYAQSSPVDSYTPCAKATQRLNVPADIHLDGPGVERPGHQWKLSFIFSQDGIDAYVVQTGERWSVLLIFQDEKVRREQLRYAVNSGLISWMYFQTNLGRQNWKPIADLKYVRMEFSWLGDSDNQQIFLNYAEYFAPLECDSLTTFPNTMPSSLLGNYLNISPSTPLPTNSLAYKAAVEMDKARAEDRKRATKEYWEKRKREQEELKPTNHLN